MGLFSWLKFKRNKSTDGTTAAAPMPAPTAPAPAPAAHAEHASKKAPPKKGGAKKSK